MPSSTETLNIRPCPFCGHGGVLEYKSGDELNNQHWRCGCSVCRIFTRWEFGSSTWRVDNNVDNTAKRAAINYWNRRSDSNPSIHKLDEIEGDLLPPVGSRVFIHLSSVNDWIEHTVIGYYAWGSHKADVAPDSYFRVFVRVIDSKGFENARLLNEVERVYPKTKTAPEKPVPLF